MATEGEDSGSGLSIDLFVRKKKVPGYFSARIPPHDGRPAAGDGQFLRPAPHDPAP